MTPEERQMLSGLFDRIRGASNGPKDREAEAFIDDAMRNTPSAGYVLAQTVLVQQQALESAAKRVEQLEAQAKAAQQPPQEGGFLGNIGRSLFGGAQPAPQQQPPQGGYDARSYDPRAYEQRAPEPPPGYGQRPAWGAPPPPAQPGPAGPWGAPAAPQGGGFLQGALKTATGVAGGVLLGNAIGGLFGGHGGGMFGGGLGGGGLGGAPQGTVNETVNNYYENDPGGRDSQGIADVDSDRDYAQDASYDDSSDGPGDNNDDYA